MKKLLIGVIVLAVLAGAAGVGAVFYVRPDPMLDLRYAQVPVKQKALDMVKRLSFEMVLTEEDVNNLLKKSLADHPRRGKNTVVEGAAFSLEGDRLTADLRLRWKDRVPVGMRAAYRLIWQEPVLEATVEKVTVKGIELPTDLVEDMALQVDQELPEPLRIKNITFAGNELRVTFHRPSLQDLKRLIA